MTIWCQSFSYSVNYSISCITIFTCQVSCLFLSSIHLSLSSVRCTFSLYQTAFSNNFVSGLHVSEKFYVCFSRYRVYSVFCYTVMCLVHCIVILQTLKKYENELVGDPIIKSHLKSLYDNLLEQNLCRIIEPFSRVQVEHIAKLVGLDVVSPLYSINMT